MQTKSLLSSETTSSGTYDHPRFLLANTADSSPQPSLAEDDAAGNILSGHRLAALLVPLFPTGRVGERVV